MSLNCLSANRVIHIARKTKWLRSRRMKSQLPFGEQGDSYDSDATNDHGKSGGRLNCLSANRVIHIDESGTSGRSRGVGLNCLSANRVIHILRQDRAELRKLGLNCLSANRVIHISTVTSSCSCPTPRRSQLPFGEQGDSYYMMASSEPPEGNKSQLPFGEQGDSYYVRCAHIYILRPDGLNCLSANRVIHIWLEIGGESADGWHEVSIAFRRTG